MSTPQPMTPQQKMQEESPEPIKVNLFHRYSDVDASEQAHHHTLGIDNNQASPGNHTHNGRDSLFISASNGTGLPVGSVALKAHSGPIDGWLDCNGAQVSRETYINLFNVIGVAFGTGDGATTFNVPNMGGPIGGVSYMVKT